MTAYWKQTLEAAGWTFLQVFVVTFGASAASLGSLAWADLKPAAASAALAAAGAALSLIKSLLVKNLGAVESPLISDPEVCVDTAVRVIPYAGE
jgi:hypothetical protein